MHGIDRRAFLVGSAAAVAGAARADRPRPKRVAAVVTVYRPDSHADVIVSKILRGWHEDGGAGPDLEVAALYVDQRSTNDMSRRLSREHGFPICGTIREALTLGYDGLAVDGVLSIGEHGEYPWNSRGQHLYPRRRFFREITDTFAAHDAVVPVFNDKHPGPTWEDASWMANRARELGVPWMAGSSLTVGYRSPDVTLPFGARVRSCLAVGYSGLDVYGFHTLDFLQSILERRSGGERGVSSVLARPTSDLCRWIDAGLVQRPLLEVALDAAGTSLHAALRARIKDGALFEIRYRDGLVAPVLMLSGVAKAIVAVVEPDEGPVVVTRAEELTEPRYPHFAYLLRGIERMVHEGRPAYPVERTLLAAGVLDRLLRSRQEGYVRRATPELAIAYEGVDYPHAPHIELGGLAG
jgi:hypothetical protein